MLKFLSLVLSIFNCSCLDLQEFGNTVIKSPCLPSAHASLRALYDFH